MRFPHLLLLALIAIHLSCVYPVYDGDPAALEEQQSVWQYLKVYSIYHDRLPVSCGPLTPEGMFGIINDTLGGHRYTDYVEEEGSGGGGGEPGPVIDDDNAYYYSDSTVYIYIPEFSNDAEDFFKTYLYALSRYRNIIIDLRYNPGGYLRTVSYMLGEILPAGTEYIKIRMRQYNEKTRSGVTVEENSKTANPRPNLRGKNIAVLMNRYSASASEMLAAGLKDGLRDKGAKMYLIGEKSYGKGIGQVTAGRDGRRKELRITLMEISGITERTGEYHRVGIEPDEIPEDALDEAIDIFAFLLKSRHPLADAALAQSESILKNAYGRRFYTIEESKRRAMLLAESLELFCAVKMLEPSFGDGIMPETPDIPDEGDEEDGGDDADGVGGDDGGADDAAARLRKLVARSGMPIAAQLRDIAKNGAPKPAVPARQPIGLIVTDITPLEHK
jgi:hypothetical protein